MTALSAAMRRSQASASDSPAPAAAPGSEAITGLGMRKIRPAVSRCESRWRWMRSSSDRPMPRLPPVPAAMPFTSPPEQNAPPAPVSTMQRTSVAVSASRSAAARPRSISSESALRRSGRFMTRSATPSSTRACR